MSNHKLSKENYVNTRQTVMGDFFSKKERSEKSPAAGSRKRASTTEKAKQKGQKSPVKNTETKQKTSPSEKRGNKTKEILDRKSEDSSVKSKKVEVRSEKAAEEKKKEPPAKIAKVSGKDKKKTEKEEQKKKLIEKKPEKAVEKKAGLRKKVTGAGMFSFSWTRGAQRDTEDYRNGYPNKEDDPALKANLKFYMNEIPSRPDGDFIDMIHVNWWGDYKLLEVHHGYIQWLFPIRESGLNWHAQELQLHEIKKLQKNKKAMKRILTSYKMMLNFYGMELVNENDGTIQRGDNWRERFNHLNRSFHNYLRITRILKCLGEFGYEHLKKNFVKFVLYEGLETGELSNVIDSCVKYWIGVLKDDDEREEVFDYYEKLYDENQAKRTRSPSPPSMWEFNKTSKSSAVKEDKATKGYNGNEEEFSDDEHSAIGHAKNLMEKSDDENDNDKGSSNNLKPAHKIRKDHEISDDDSLEMKYWDTEKQSAQNTSSEDESGRQVDGSDEVNENESNLGNMDRESECLKHENDLDDISEDLDNIEKVNHEKEDQSQTEETNVSQQTEEINKANGNAGGVNKVNEALEKSGEIKEGIGKVKEDMDKSDENKEVINEQKEELKGANENIAGVNEVNEEMDKSDEIKGVNEQTEEIKEANENIEGVNKINEDTDKSGESKESVNEVIDNMSDNRNQNANMCLNAEETVPENGGEEVMDTSDCTEGVQTDGKDASKNKEDMLENIEEANAEDEKDRMETD